MVDEANNITCILRDVCIWIQYRFEVWGQGGFIRSSGHFLQKHTQYII